MSLKSFRDVISTSFELEDSDVIDNLYRKLKDRLGEFLEVSRMLSTMFLMRKSYMTNLGLKLSKTAPR